MQISISCGQANSPACSSIRHQEKKNPIIIGTCTTLDSTFLHFSHSRIWKNLKLLSSFQFLNSYKPIITNGLGFEETPVMMVDLAKQISRFKNLKTLIGLISGFEQ